MKAVLSCSSSGSGNQGSSANHSLRQRTFRFHDETRITVRLEQAFWAALEFIADQRSITIGQLVKEVVESHEGESSASALRMYAIDVLRAHKI